MDVPVDVPVDVGVDVPVDVAAFDPESTSFVADPYPVFAALRRAGGPLWHEQLGMWLAFSYADVDAVLRSRKLGRVFTRRRPEAVFGTFNQLHVDSMLDSEPPDHTRRRRLVQGEFARGRMERLRSTVARAADRLLDEALAGGGELDLVADYAAPLPVTVIAELLGVPEGDRRLLRPWSNAIVKMYEYQQTDEQRMAAVRAAGEFAGYLRELATRRRAEPADDLVSHLAGRVAGGELSEDELVANAALLLNAGHEASVNVLANGMLALLDRPAELDRLRAGLPALLPTAIEELIRFDAPLQLFERTAQDDVVVGGVTVRAGQKIAALLGSANRDPAVFADPDRLDVGRDPNPHLGFGAGIHFCLGAPLARLELEVSLPTLLRRLPALELAARPVRRTNFVIRGLDALLVRPLPIPPPRS